MRCKKLVEFVLATALLACGMGVGMAGAAEPLKIRIAWIAAPANLAPILFTKEGIARHLGKSYVPSRSDLAAARR